ncbi:MAG: hypothetical protein ACE5HS_18895 [bacterium]
MRLLRFARKDSPEYFLPDTHEQVGSDFVYLKNGSKKQPVKVNLGLRNSKKVVETGNLKAGDRLTAI